RLAVRSAAPAEGHGGCTSSRPMPDLDTCRIPRDTLAGLIATTNNSDQQRITAPMPLTRLDELLDESEVAPAVVVAPPPASESAALEAAATDTAIDAVPATALSPVATGSLDAAIDSAIDNAIANAIDAAIIAATTPAVA